MVQIGSSTVPVGNAAEQLTADHDGRLVFADVDQALHVGVGPRVASHLWMGAEGEESDERGRMSWCGLAPVSQAGQLMGRREGTGHPHSPSLPPHSTRTAAHFGHHQVLDVVLLQARFCVDCGIINTQGGVSRVCTE